MLAKSTTVECPGCFKKLKCPPEAVGRRVKCPGCAESIAVPAAEAGFEVVPEDQYEVVEEPTPIAKRPVNARRLRDEVDEDAGDAMVRCPTCGEDNYADARRCADCKARLTENDGTDAPRKKKYKKPKSEPVQHQGFFSTEKSLVNSGVVGGALAMIGATVWFVLGLQADRIFFYPPVLFIVGFVAVIKGAIGQEE